MINILYMWLVAIVIVVIFMIKIISDFKFSKRSVRYFGNSLSLKSIAFIVSAGIFSSAYQLVSAGQQFDYHSDDAIKKGEKSAQVEKGYIWQTLPENVPYPHDNPITPSKVMLGKKLFFEKRLSADNSISCASCHELSLEKAGADGLPKAIGINRRKGSRNTPTVLNTAYQRYLFWDGRVMSLEQQALGPLLNPLEMAMPSTEAIEQKIYKIPEYRALFKKAFPESSNIAIDNIVKAIATYERTLITPNTAYDRYVKGDIHALSKSQIRGMVLFESIGCISCHSGANFSGASFDKTNGAFRLFPSVRGSQYESKYKLANDSGAINGGKNKTAGVWRIPSLRNVSLTAPYFHNGSVNTLEDAVRIMASLQLNKKLSNNLATDRKIDWQPKKRTYSISEGHALSDNEVKDIVNFLHALTGEIPKPLI